MMTVLELVVSVAVVVVAAVVWVGVVCAPSVNSVSAPLPLRLAADVATGALRPANASARTAHRQSDAARWRDDWTGSLNTRRA